MYLLALIADSSSLPRDDAVAVAHVTKRQANLMLDKLRLAALLQQEYQINSFTEGKNEMCQDHSAEVCWCLPDVWFLRVPAEAQGALLSQLVPPNTVRVCADLDIGKFVPCNSADEIPFTDPEWDELYRLGRGQWRFCCHRVIDNTQEAGPVPVAHLVQADGVHTYPVFERHLHEVIARTTDQEQSP